jgi:hypothetical protein
VTNRHLGKRPPSNKPALMLADFLSGVVPAVPQAADNFAGVPSWELGHNDEYGTCGPTSVANNRRLVSYGLTGTMDAPTWPEIADLYRRSGNPGFNPNLPGGDPKQDDNGVDMQTMLGELLKNGIGGRKPLAFAKIAAGDMTTLDAAVALFGGTLLGLTLDTAQQSQTDIGTWTHVSSPVWGGHAVASGRYVDPAGTASDRTAVITWAEIIDMDRGFVTSQMDEDWVVLWPEHLGSKEFCAGVNIGALASAYQSLTGRSFPVIPVPPIPTPVPIPVPGPGGDAEAALAVALRRLLKSKGLPKYFRDAAAAWLIQH